MTRSLRLNDRTSSQETTFRRNLIEYRPVRMIVNTPMLIATMGCMVWKPPNTSAIDPKKSSPVLRFSLDQRKPVSLWTIG